MIVVDEKAERALASKLEEIRLMPRQRCIHLPAPTVDNSAHYRAYMLRAITQSLGAYNPTVYLCADNDCFILGTNISKKDYDAMMAALKRSGYTPPKDEDLMYDVAQSWGFLRYLVQSKLPKEEPLKTTQKVDEPNYGLLAATLAPTVAQRIKTDRLAHKRLSILVVEDDTFTRRLIHNVLKEESDVAFAIDGKDAISAYLLNAPHMLFLDIGLPDVSGHGVLDKVLEADPEAHIIMLSGNSDRTNVLAAMQRGAKGFVAKPFTREKVLHYLKAYPPLQPL
jgi:two-component system chemotaxis response regulator CheY